MVESTPGVLSIRDCEFWGKRHDPAFRIQKRLSAFSCFHRAQTSAVYLTFARAVRICRASASAGLLAKAISNAFLAPVMSRFWERAKPR